MILAKVLSQKSWNHSYLKYALAKIILNRKSRDYHEAGFEMLLLLKLVLPPIRIMKYVNLKMWKISNYAFSKFRKYLSVTFQEIILL